MQFYENFINMCNAINKSPSSVAQALGISKSNVTAWKKGSTPKSEVLSIIAEYFAVSADYLLGLSDIKKPPTLRTMRMYYQSTMMGMP